MLAGSVKCFEDDPIEIEKGNEPDETGFKGGTQESVVRNQTGSEQVRVRKRLVTDAEYQ